MIKKLMQSREKLKRKILSTFENFNIKYIETSGLFDFIARDKKDTVFIKVVVNIDGITENTARNLNNISYGLDVYSIVIGEKTRLCKLKDGIIYKRFGVPCMSAKSFEMFLSSEIPNVESFRGGEFVYIDPDKLREARIRKGFTQDELAELIGVSKKCIYEHEKHVKKAKKEIADIMIKILEENITTAPKIKMNSSKKIVPKTMFERLILRFFSKLGMNVNYVSNTSFNMLLKEKSILTYAEKTIKEYKTDELVSISKFIRKPAIIISEERVKTRIPVLLRDELPNLNKEEFMRLIE